MLLPPHSKFSQFRIDVTRHRLQRFQVTATPLSVNTAEKKEQKGEFLYWVTKYIVDRDSAHFFRDFLQFATGTLRKQFT